MFVFIRVKKPVHIKQSFNLVLVIDVYSDHGGAQGQVQEEASGQGCVRGELQWPEFSHRISLPWRHAAVEPA